MAKGYILIPDEIVERADLTPAHKLVIGVLARLQGDSSWCYPSLDYLVRATAVSRRQIVRIVNDLATRKEIIRLKHGRGKPNTYSVPWVTARATRKRWAEKRARAAS